LSIAIASWYFLNFNIYFEFYEKVKFEFKKCLSEGVVKNFGTPKELMNDENSIFCELTKKLSPSEKKYINDIANSVDNDAKKLTEESKRAEINESTSNKKLLNDKLKNDVDDDAKFTYVNEGADLNEDGDGIDKTRFIKTNVEITKESKIDLNIKFSRYSTINAPSQINFNPNDLLDETQIKEVRL
jgi:hypothetical protein